VKLRARFALTSLTVALPVIGALSWLDADTRQVAAERDLAAVTLRYMQAPGERERCEADPARWGGRPLPPPPAAARRPHGPDQAPARDEPHGAPLAGFEPPPKPPPPPGGRPGGAPPVLYAYDARLISQNPRAPSPEAALRSGLWPQAIVHTLVTMPWSSGPCAYVLARGSINPRWLGGLLPHSPLWMLPIALVPITLLVTLGTAVRRILRLTRAVRESAAVHFAATVPAEGDDEIAELARAFQAASTELRKQLAEKDQRERSLREFVANTTHDLMIPLTVLKSHLATIHEQGRAGAPLDPSALRGAMNEAHYIGALTQNLGVASKLDAGAPQITRARVDLGALVERVLARHRPIARQLEIELDGAVPEQPLEVIGDVTLIEQAVNNVVYNSVRYNRPGGHVALTLDRVAPERFQLRVVDDGPGIAAERLSRLAERGFRDEAARTRAPEGQGLGLNIALRVTQLLGMELDFAASEYGGLQVDFSGACLAHER
jgi:two-component system sensor histidine kinase BaeS